MQASENQLKRIQDKFQLLAKQFQQLQKENEKFREEQLLFTTRIHQLGQELDRSRQETAVSRISGHTMDGSEKKDLEKRLSQYVREIDRCITILND